ncbi:MAG TPA: hypothetical protein VFV39_07230 [Limnobacter sp.]|nr:hypothetical protein [Limnobacter sp.]
MGDIFVAHDTLEQTLCKVYGIGSNHPMLNGLVQLHLQLNPDIFAAHRPLQKKVIYLAELHANRDAGLTSGQQNNLLSTLHAQKTMLSGSKQSLENIVPHRAVEAEAMRFVLGFNEVVGHVGTGAGIGASTVGTLAGRHLHADLLEFNRWANGKAGWVKANQGKDLLHHYDARMDDVVKRIQTRLGPTERFLFNGKNTKDALFNGVPQSLRPNPITISAAERIKQVAGAARVGGAALVLVDAALTCQKLSATAKEHKVETAYKEIGGFFGGLLTGAGVGLALVSMATPVGWVGAIVISAGTGYGGKAVGEALGLAALRTRGDMLHLKDERLLNRWCN